MKSLIAALIISCCLSPFYEAKAQSQEAQQLLLNWEKLSQLKSILKNMYNGYKVVSKGFNTVKDISQGNYKLHQVFFDGLLEVSPAVKKYKRIGEIIRYQQRIMQQHKIAFNYFKNTSRFTPSEVKYIEKIYGNIFSQSLKNLDELLMVITASQLRMSDDERLQAIDRIYADIEEKFAFMQSFNNSTKLLAVQRAKEQSEVDMSNKLYNLK